MKTDPYTASTLRDLEFSLASEVIFARTGTPFEHKVLMAVAIGIIVQCQLSNVPFTLRSLEQELLCSFDGTTLTAPAVVMASIEQLRPFLSSYVNWAADTAVNRHRAQSAAAMAPDTSSAASESTSR